LQQAAAAFAGDIGISTDLLPESNCTAVQTDCLAAPSGSNAEGEHEIIADDLLKVTLYSSVLAVPAARNHLEETVVKGRGLFRTL